MATDYDSLKSEIADWLARDDLASKVDTFIDFAEARINRVLRLRAMQTTTDLTVDGETVALPTDFKYGRRLYLNTSPKRALEYLSPEQFHEIYAASETGTPKVYTIEGTNILFGPSPDSTYTGKLLYYKGFDALSSSNTTNWLITNAPDLYCFASLLMAEPFLMHDERIPVWKGFVDSAIKELNDEDWNGQASASVPQIRTDVGNP